MGVAVDIICKLPGPLLPPAAASPLLWRPLWGEHRSSDGRGSNILTHTFGSAALDDNRSTIATCFVISW